MEEKKNVGRVVSAIEMSDLDQVLRCKNALLVARDEVHP